ncbi:hypothetical protein AB0C12_24970 [Actinoplanes sp. NPDC048967]|uniref:hypothetical protein n=1 Tax=Actinoplanes sp. NPDC048967 TaxID=3155269 RepID=UPI0033E33AC8
MFTKKLGRFTAGLFVALGLSFGGLLATNAVGSNATVAAPISVIEAQFDFEWH